MTKITILTSYMHQRGGDLTAALSFMKSILAYDATIQFSCIVKRDISAFKKDKEAIESFFLKELPKEVQFEFFLLDSKDYDKYSITKDNVFDGKKALTPEELTKMSDKNWGTISIGYPGWNDVHEKLKQTGLKLSDLIVVCGNPHRLNRADYELLNSFQKPITLLPEYGLNHPQNKVYFKTTEMIHTGFSLSTKPRKYCFNPYKTQEGFGVYIDDTVLSRKKLDEIESDEVFVEYLTKSDFDMYRKSHILFYGYFNDISGVNNIVDIAPFITNSIILAMKQKVKANIDIVLPGYPDPTLIEVCRKAIQALPDEYQAQLKKATYDYVGKSTQVLDDHKTHRPYKVRLINPGRLQRETIQALLNESSPWVGLTGDASWVEGLMKGKIVCYQTMVWKKLFFAGFIDYIEQKLGHESPLVKFYKAQCEEGCFERMQDIYLFHEEKMRQEALSLATLIYQEKNLSSKIVEYFLSKNLIPKHPKPAALTIAATLPEPETKAVPIATAEAAHKSINPVLAFLALIKYFFVQIASIIANWLAKGTENLTTNRVDDSNTDTPAKNFII